MMLRPAILTCLLLLSVPARAEDLPRIGVAAPLSGPSAILGGQLAKGAERAAKGKAAIVEADTACTAEGGRSAAERFVSEKVAIVVGFLCTESLEAALPVLRAAGIPTIDVGVRADRFTAHRRRTGDLVWRLAPRADAEAKALSALVASRWRDVPFGILDDGSIYARGLADAVRARLEEAGLRPAAIDTFRPAEEKQFGIARRLTRTGVTRFVVAGERTDAAIIARDAAAGGTALEMIGGESFLDEPNEAAGLPVGTIAVAPRMRFPEIAGEAGTEAVERQGYFGPGFAAVQIALVVSRPDGRPDLNGQAFDTALGRIAFDANGDADLDLFLAYRFDGRDFVPDSGQ